MNLSNIKNHYSVVIVGSGLAGLYAALNFPSDVDILMLSKKERHQSNSSLAQGGVACVLDLENDSYELHIEDTLIAGKRENDIEAVTQLVEEGPADVLKTIEYGVEYDRDENGKLIKTLEGGHCRRRIVHHKDTSGKELVDKLMIAVEKLPNVTIADETMVTSMSRIKNGFEVEIMSGSEYKILYADYCLLASGGIGRVYQYTTNPSVATGDGIRLAYEMGAAIKNLSYVQFHPTAFNGANREQFLISEAVRGEGAYLLNCNKERFMHRYDERLELAPRDVVSRSIIMESRRLGSNNFYLDIRYKGEEYLKNRFPGIYAGCLKQGVDISKDLIPVFPCQHYLMGGIEVDLNARTTLPRLYAAGECACTGVHGKNRLASNSLLEALVFGRRAAEDIMRCINAGFYKLNVPEERQVDRNGAPLPKGTRTEIREIMQKAYFVIPDEGAIHQGKKRIENILNRLKNGKFAVTADYCEALSLATVAYIILKEVDR
ncbi:MAG: FAD-binding protein [Clostridia bacterium]|nr:FAD-binding protein [Clostridia bacterium]MBP3560733.1 FAD-binding protein [Clostridia bacterium]